MLNCSDRTTLTLKLGLHTTEGLVLLGEYGGGLTVAGAWAGLQHQVAQVTHYQVVLQLDLGVL